MDVFVTGRLCLLGEHSDWAGEFNDAVADGVPGRTLVIGTDQGMHATAKADPSATTLTFTASDADGGRQGPRAFPLDDEEALAEEAAAGGFWSYVAGTALCVVRDARKRNVAIGGLLVDNHTTTLPARKGLSSSAAVCVLVVRSFCAAYPLLAYTVRDEMELAYQGEVATPSQCGRMDQACAYGRTPVMLTFDGARVTTDALPVGADVHLVFADLEASKDTVAILGGLRAAYPVPANEAHAKLHRLLGALNADIVGRAAAALAKGKAAELGAIMTEAQAAFDDAAAPLVPDQLEAPVLHRVLADTRVRSLSLGGKGVGSQGDGAVQFVCRDAEQQRALCDLLTSPDFRMTPYRLTVRRSAPALPPADEV